MTKKIIRYSLLIVVVGLLAYNSLYFKKLDAKVVSPATNLNPQEFAQKFWVNEFIPYLDSAIEINSFLKMLKKDINGTFKKYSRSQGIGDNSFFLVKGEGLIKAINEDSVIVMARSGTDEIKVQLNTGIYFGNAIRDVTGKISMGDFINTMDFNVVSVELNKIVHTQVVLPFKTKAVNGAMIHFVACMEINKGPVGIEKIRVLPVKININQ